MPRSSGEGFSALGFRGEHDADVKLKARLAGVGSPGAPVHSLLSSASGSQEFSRMRQTYIRLATKSVLEVQAL